jgi:hypothetical protein
MKWRAEVRSPEVILLEIEHDPQVGYYLFIWKEGQCIRDELQDTLEIAMQSAEDSYGVARSAWVKVGE